MCACVWSAVIRDTHDYPFAKITPPKELTVKDSEEAELTRMANAITSVPYHLQREFTDAELVEFKRCFDQIDVDRASAGIVLLCDVLWCLTQAPMLVWLPHGRKWQC